MFGWHQQWRRGGLAGCIALAVVGGAVSASGTLPWDRHAGRDGAPSPALASAVTKIAPFDVATALRHLPKVALSVTDDVPEANLFRKAVALSAVGQAQAPLRAEIATTEQIIETDAVTATLDEAAAETASSASASAAAVARRAAARYRSLKGEVQQTALGLYMSGTEDQPTSVRVGSADEFALAQDYFQIVVGPQGVLDARAAALHARQAATSTSDAARIQAGREASHARALLAAEKGAARRLEAQLRTSAGSNAGAVLADHRILVAQEAKELTRASALQFTPSKPLPAPVATTAAALTWAFGELGKPYLWGGTGPGAFDCSGLTQYAWNKAGVTIPRVAADQDAWTDPVPLSQLLPGDLVFYGTSYIHHVGVYIGGGLMINAPHTGTVVQVSSIWWSDLAGFGRVHADGTPTASHELPSVKHPAPRVVKAKKPVPSESKPPRKHPGKDKNPLSPLPTTTTSVAPVTVPPATVPPTTVPPATAPPTTVPPTAPPLTTAPPTTSPPATIPTVTTTTAPAPGGAARGP